MAAGVSKCLRGAVWRKGTNRPFPPGCAQSTDFSGNPEDEWAQKPQKTHETHKSCSEAAPELLFGSRQTKLAEACRPSSSENGGFASVLPQLWVLSSDHRGQSFETIPGVSEQAKSPQTMDRDPLKSPPSHTAGRGCGSGGLTPISPHQLPPQKKKILSVPEAVCPPEPRLCVTSQNKITVPCYSEGFLQLSQVLFCEKPNAITLFRPLANWLNIID